MDLESTPIYQYGAPMGTSLQPAESSKSILTPGYELHPRLINMVQDKLFLGDSDENPLFPPKWVWANLLLTVVNVHHNPST
jgi:hypothetical protein